METEIKFLILGATHNIAFLTAKILNESGKKVIAAVENPNEVSPFEALNIETQLIDFDNIDSILKITKGIKRLFFILPFNEKMVSRTENIVKAAKKNNVKFLVRYSTLGAIFDSKYSFIKHNGNADKIVMDSDISHSIVKPNILMQNLFAKEYLEMLKNNEIKMPFNEVKISFVDARDIANVVAEILLEAEYHHNSIYNLTGAESITYKQVCEVLSKNLKRNISFHPCSEEEIIKELKNKNLSEFLIEAMISFAHFINDEFAAAGSNTIRQITGKNPIRFEKFVQEHLKNWNS